MTSKPYGPGVLWGGLLFGVGWALAGTCPGTALAQIGEGKLAGIVTFAGIVLGAYVQNRWAVGRARARITPRSHPGLASPGRAA